MPIYEFECPNGHVTERIINLSDYVDNIICPASKEDSEKACLQNAQIKASAPANIQIGKPTRVFINPRTGKTMPASSSYDKPPRGYIEKELKGPIERSKFEKEEQRKIDVTNEIVTHQLDSQKEEARKNRQADINANLSKFAAESDNPEGAKHLIKSAMNRTIKKRLRPRHSEVKFAVNHQNANNMDEVK